MNTQAKSQDGILSTDEAWDSGELGTDMEFAKVAAEESTASSNADLDDILGLQSISIRLPKNLIEEYKALATLEGMGYQPLMREVLKRWADAEMRKVFMDAIKADQERRRHEEEQRAELDKRKAA